MSAISEICTKWGLPDWTIPDLYPDHTIASDRLWRWEFVRRQTDYRKKFEIADRWESAKEFQDQGQIIRLARSGAIMLADRKYSYPNDYPLLSVLEAFNQLHGFIVGESGFRRGPPSYHGDHLVDYRFSLVDPLPPQISKAEAELREAQEAKYGGVKNSPRPSRELWATYLRVLDARECKASWREIGDCLWPTDGGNIKDKARHTHASAVTVRDNFKM